MKNDNIKRVSYSEEINRLVSQYKNVRETCDEHNLLYLISACDLIDAWTESIEKRRKNE